MVRQIGHIGSLAHRGFAAVDLENGAAKVSRVCRMGLRVRRRIRWKIVKLSSLVFNWLLLLLDLGGKHA